MPDPQAESAATRTLAHWRHEAGLGVYSGPRNGGHGGFGRDYRIVALAERLQAVAELVVDLTEEVDELRADVPPVGPSRVAHMYRTAGLSDARDRLATLLAKEFPNA
jgi:hypothetical protein